MKFKFKQKFNQRDIQARLKRATENITSAVLDRMELVGWEFVKMAREKTAAQGGFNDVTGNLRSSIGFAIVDHGVVKTENYEGKGRLGKQEAKNFIRELKGDFEEGYALIVVAGMDYAAAVESRGKDVITGSSLEAEATLKTAIANIQRKLKTKK